MATSTLILREFGSCNLELSPTDYADMRTRYSGRLDVTPTEQAGLYKLTARDYVGRIALPAKRTLIIEPKIEVTNLFYMLCVEAGVVSFYQQRVSLNEHNDIFSIILAFVVRETEELVAKGLYTDYFDAEEDLPLVRGKIRLGAQIGRYGGLKHRHVCRFAEATLETSENRVVATTLRHTAHMLRLAEETSMFSRARVLLQHFDVIPHTTISTALGLFGQLQKHRLNRAYWPLLGLCALVLRGLSLSSSSGEHQFASFLVDMPRLFESFITARLMALLPNYGLHAVAQRHDYLDAARQVGIRPDILVYSARGATPLLVLDAKYRQPEAQHEGLNRDLYQVSAYMHRYGLSRGVLIYPQWERPSPSSVRLLGTPKELYIANLDLSAPNPATLENECTKLAEQIATLSA